jgi:hypothetical protein
LQLDDCRPVNEFDLIARALAERLQRHRASEGLRAALVFNLSAGWEDVAARATGEFVLPAFAAAVRDLGLIGSLAPELRAFLAMAHTANVKRNGGLRGQLAAVVGALNRAGVEPVLLKGAIRLADGLYPDPGWRIMRDLDLLVPGDRLGDAVAALRGAGYACRPSTPGEPPPFGHHHYPELTRPGDRASVELHAELLKTERQRRLLPAAEVSRASRPMTFDGVRARLPSLDHQVVHLVGHSQIANYGHYCARVQLRDRLEAAALERWSPERPDWAGIARRFAAAGYRYHLASFLVSLDDAGFPRGPAGVGAGTLAAGLHRRRIALQARSPTMMRIGAQLGWYAAAAREAVLDPSTRRRLVHTSFGVLARKVQRGPATR